MTDEAKRAQGEGESPVYLRPLTEEDADIAYAWWRDPIVQGLSGAPLGPRDPEEFRRFFVEKYVRPNPRRIAAGIVVKETGKLIGLCVAYIDPDFREAEYGIKIGDRSSWGKGYGTAATRAFIDLVFETTGIDSLFGLVELTNERAKRTLISAGFRICCLLYNREFLRVDLTRYEWECDKRRRQAEAVKTPTANGAAESANHTNLRE
ncbi:MAG: GNAT family N-acetyltransferase [Anaerolineae bacterium]